MSHLYDLNNNNNNNSLRLQESSLQPETSAL